MPILTEPSTRSAEGFDGLFRRDNLRVGAGIARCRRENGSIFSFADRGFHPIRGGALQSIINRRGWYAG